MSQENVEAVRRGYEALNRRDIDAWLEGFDANAEMHDLAEVPDAPVRRGHDDLREWVAMMDDTWEDGRYEPEEVTETGQFTLVAVRARARGRGSGAPVDFQIFHVFEMRDQKVQRFWAYLDKAKALEAVGLRE